MNFLQRIKADLDDIRNRRGGAKKVYVDARDLRELVTHFERLDTEARALHPEARKQQLMMQLHDTLTAAYCQEGKSAERTLMVVMDTLRPLMESRHKEQEAIRTFGA